MKRILVAALIVVLVAVIGLATFQKATASPERSMASLMPQGALVFLEAKDFAGLLHEWNESPEKAAWLKSDNYETFSRSRLFLRLQQAQQEFAGAAGVPPDYKFLGEVAGGQSALGIYDIGKLEVLYVSKLASTSSMKSAIWQQRSKFEPRQASGKQFFVRTEPESGRVVAFAIDGDYLVLGTREDLVAGALSLLAGQKLATLEQQSWYVNSVKAAKDQGDLRLLVNLAEVTHTPHFRSYWIQQNITELRQYESSITDLYRTGTEYREERALLLKSSDKASDPEDAKATGKLVQMVPADAGVWRAAATPSADEVLAVLEQKVLTPRLGPTPPAKVAPTVSLGSGTVGSGSNLETRIDVEPPVAAEGDGTRGDEALKSLLTNANVRAMMQMHRSEVAPDGVFVRLHSAVVLSAASDWDQQKVLEVFRQTVAPGATAGSLGTNWKQSGTGEASYLEMDGLTPIVVAVRGKILVASSDASTVLSLLSQINSRAAEETTYSAGFRHDGERENFYKMTGLLDQASRNNYTGASDSTPEYFSQNVASLSKTLSGVKSETITVKRSGNMDLQTVRYEWAK